ncbi:hypothetical protein I4U23_010518 [Adineta vaga]|nr:hypothetical protein I4U23_010518 [Adineta vaga]
MAKAAKTRAQRQQRGDSFHRPPTPITFERVFYNSNLTNQINNHQYPFTKSDGENPHYYSNKTKNKFNNNIDLRNVKVNISMAAMNYAVQQYLPSIRICCIPKIFNDSIAEDLIDELFVYIEKYFHALHEDFDYPLNFDYWHLDRTGDIVCYTRNIELYVYFCDSRNYPSSLTTTDIFIPPPKHLPWQRMIRLNFVPNYITLEEIQHTLSLYFRSIFHLQEIFKTQTHRWRHLQLELLSKREYEQFVHDGEIMINAHLIHIEPFVAPLRLLLCSKCNDPGHFNSICDFYYNACPRCGEDRTIEKYRRALYVQVAEQRYLLTPSIRTFIPKEHRREYQKYERTSNRITFIENNDISKRQISPVSFNINDHIQSEPIETNKVDSRVTQNVMENIKPTKSIVSDQTIHCEQCYKPSDEIQDVQNTEPNENQTRITFREACNNLYNENDMNNSERN